MRTCPHRLPTAPGGARPGPSDSHPGRMPGSCHSFTRPWSAEGRPNHSLPDHRAHPLRPAFAQVGRGSGCPWMTVGDRCARCVLARLWHDHMRGCLGEPEKWAGKPRRHRRGPARRDHQEPAQEHPVPARAHQRVPCPDRAHPRTRTAVDLSLSTSVAVRLHQESCSAADW